MDCSPGAHRSYTRWPDLRKPQARKPPKTAPKIPSHRTLNPFACTWPTFGKVNKRKTLKPTGHIGNDRS